MSARIITPAHSSVRWVRDIAFHWGKSSSGIRENSDESQHAPSEFSRIPLHDTPSHDGSFDAVDGGQIGGDAFEVVAAVAAAPELAGRCAEPDRRVFRVIDIEPVAQHGEP